MTSSATLKQRKAANLKFSTPAIITLCEMIMMRYDVILNQSECANLYDHRKNYTKKNVLKTHNILDKTVVSFGSSIWELLIS